MTAAVLASVLRSTEWGRLITNAILEPPADAFGNNAYVVLKTRGDGNCLFTSVSAGLALLDNGPHALAPDPSSDVHVFRGLALRALVVKHYLEAYDPDAPPHVRERRDILNAVASKEAPPSPPNVPGAPDASSAPAEQKSMPAE